MSVSEVRCRCATSELKIFRRLALWNALRTPNAAISRPPRDTEVGAANGCARTRRREGGHLETLKWANARTTANRGHEEMTCAGAARFGHLEMLQVGARERLPVGRLDVHVRGGAGPPRGAEVGTRERLPVGRRHVHGRGGGRATSRC